MSKVKLIILSVVLSIFLTTVFTSTSGAISLDISTSPCSMTNSFEYYEGITVIDCIKECAKRTVCVAINYNRHIAFCALRTNISVKLTGREPAWCYDIVVDNETDVHIGLCKDRPCNETSICTNSTSSPFYTCTQAYCIPETNISNASFRNKILTPVGKKNEILCDIGYEAVGTLSTTCLPDGSWSSLDLKCLKTCPPIPVKPSATASFWSTYRFILNTTVNYVCKEGFYNITEATIICDEHGQWSAFDCLPYCRQTDLTQISNGHPKPGDYYTIYMEAEYECNPGYYLSSESRFVTCDNNGQWSDPQVSCFPYCKQDDIPIVNNGSPLFGELYNFTMTAKYSCNTGYYISEGSPDIACDTYGSWSTPEVECYPYCSQPGITNGYIQTSVPEPIMKDVTVQYNCNGGHYPYPLAGTTTCQQTGLWTSASCYKYCGSAPNYDWELVSHYSAEPPYIVGIKVTYKCTAGVLAHFSGGGDSKTCNIHGNWDGEVHCCAKCYEYKDGECKLTFGCIG